MERDILGYACRKCGTVHYPNRTLCRQCRNNEFDAIPLPKTGKLLTFTRLHNLAADFEVADLQLGIVELENGNRVTAQLCLKNPEIGMKVRGRVEKVRGTEFKKYYGLIFYEA